MQEKINYIKSYLETIFQSLDIKPSLEVVEAAETVEIKITGDDLNFLIGFRGDSLEGLQHMLSLSLYTKFTDWTNLSVDINSYREGRREKLEDMVKSYIDRVRFFARDVDMPIMSSFERKQVHEFINGYDDVESFSVGEGRGRHVVLRPVSKG